MDLFFDATLHAETKTVVLPEAEAKHLIKSLRLRAGDTLQLTNGKGFLFDAKIVDDNFKACTLQIVGNQYVEPQQKAIHLAIAPTKNEDRLEWLIEKAVEIGIDAVHFILTNRTENKFFKTHRLQKISIAALKQSQQTHLPPIFEMTRFNDFILKMNGFNGNKYIAHCLPDAQKLPLSAANQSNQNALILIGPEGDFSEQEIDLARQNGFVSVGLGNNRLRTETAALVAITLLNH